MRDGDGDSGGGNGDNVETNATHSRLLNGTTTQYLNFEFVSTIYVIMVISFNQHGSESMGCCFVRSYASFILDADHSVVGALYGAWFR